MAGHRRSARLVILVLGVVIVSAAVSGCGSGDDDSAFPYGEYEANQEAGTRAEFSEDGSLLLRVGPQTLTEATFTVDGDEMTFETDSSCAQNFGEESQVATYRWTLEGDQLSTEVVGEDACEARVSGMTAGFTAIAEDS